MARPKALPDSEVFAALRQILALGDAKSVSFGSVARAVGLAPSTLVQRFGTISAMRKAAIDEGWDVLGQSAVAAIDTASDKGPSGLLKALEGLTAEAGLLLAASTEPELRVKAAEWRRMVEMALASRIPPSNKPRETAAILFAAWQGQILWGADSFRIKDLAKRLG